MISSTCALQVFISPTGLTVIAVNTTGLIETFRRLNADFSVLDLYGVGAAQIECIQDISIGVHGKQYQLS